MRAPEELNGKRTNERGVSIILIAVGMVFILGMAGLGVDLASLYVGRSQAQRAADAAALAGAQSLVAEGCTSNVGSTISSSCMTIARQRAEAVGNLNLIAGISPGITDADVTFPSTSISDPQVQVMAARDTSHSNPMPTFFVKIFGIATANVSATAKAEAFNPSGSTTSVGAECLKPWLLPNCDQGHPTSPGNPNCPGYDYFINPTTGDIENPGLTTAGVQGEQIVIKPGDPTGGGTASPGKFWPVFLPAGSVASDCPACATGSGGGGSGSGSLYRQNIECCNHNTIVCGTQVIQPITGNMVGPTEQGVDCLIHQGGSKNSPTGMDTFDPASWTITAGSANPYGVTGAIASSDSIVTIPIYDGTVLCPGSSCPSTTTVTITGFIQLFVRYEDGSNQGNVYADVMNISSCAAGAGSGSGGSGSGGGSGGTTISTGGGTPIPVRLIQ
ncbi:MAG TPA: pilus assembly protein TadG-related protein [Terriglobia bacterium]|nr:pilus assembly protein TadG-related protein [Terriglobia bacterium]